MKQQPFHFVVAYPKSDREKRREVQLARSHTARVNREKRRSNTRSQAVPQQPARTALTCSTPSADDAEPGQPFRQEHADAGDKEGLNRAFGGLDPPYVQRSASVLSSQTARATNKFTDHIEHLDVVPSRTRTLSPVLGAQSTDTFALGSSLSDTARAADYCKTCGHLLL